MNGGQPTRQQGFGLLYALLVVLLVGASVAVGMLLLRAPVPAAQIQNQEESLAWADQAVAAYAAAHSRLPCPSTTVDGEEDCSGGRAKGWLPLRTLVGASGPGPSLGPLRYMVYRGSGEATDLATAADRYLPQDAEDGDREFDGVHVNGLDLCRALANAARAGATAAAQVTDAAGNAVNVAYGIAAAGPLPGAAGRFDGRNQDDTARMESPARTAASDYDDRVRVRAFGALAQTLDCAFPSAWTPGAGALAPDPDSSAIAAMDTLSHAVDVADAAEEAQADNRSGTEIALGFAISAEVLDGVSVALAGVALASSITTLATATAALATATATCAASLGLAAPACALIPVYTSAIAVATTAVTLSGVALGLTAAALAGTSAALGMTSEAYNMAHEQPAAINPVDLSGAVTAACDGAAKLRTQADQDAASATQASTQASALATELDGWKANPSDKIDYDSYNRYDADGNLTYSLSAEERAALNVQLQAKLQAIYAEEEARLAYLQAQAQADSAKSTYDNAQNAIAYLVGTTIPAACNTGASNYSAAQCKATRDSLAALRDCDLDTDDDGRNDLDVQCAPTLYNQWQSRLAEAGTAKSAWETARDAEQALSVPNIVDYIPGCFNVVAGYCSALVIPDQREGDNRRTYARLAALYLQAAVVAADLQAQATTSEGKAQDAAQNCQDLRDLQLGGGQAGSYVGRWDGAGDIIEAADARGTVGEGETR